MSFSKREQEIIRAIKEAEEFIESAKLVLDEMEQLRFGPSNFYYGGPANADMKRASMGLSKALVKLRKPLD